MKKKTTKKVTKKKTTKKVTKKKTTNKPVEVVVRVAPVDVGKALEPIKEKSKYKLPSTWVSEKQVLKMLQKTPQEHIHSRPGKGGGSFDYVTGVYVKKVLNYVFGWLWDFKVLQHGKEGHFIWVLGELTVKNNSGTTITKTQFGRAEIKYKKDTKKIPENMLDFGNDLKAATTDALKKCASEFGIASDVYGKNEFRSVGVKDTPAPKDVVQHLKKKKEEDMKNWVVCQGNCGAVVEPNVANYSKKVYKKVYCGDCQRIKNGK